MLFRSRLGLADRIALSPELSTDEELRQLTDVAIRHGVGTLNLFLHSSVLLPGATSYTSSTGDVDAFLRRIDGWLDYLFGAAKVESVTLAEAGERFRTERSS